MPPRRLSPANNLPVRALLKTATGSLRNAYIKRDYRDGLPDKAEWGQGIIATFESGFTQGPVGFGVDGIAQYAVRLDGGRGRSGAGGIDFSPVMMMAARSPI